MCGMGPNFRLAAPPTFVDKFHKFVSPTCLLRAFDRLLSLLAYKHKSAFSMERCLFKVMGRGDKWIKLFSSSEEVASLTMDSLLTRIQERFPSLRRSTVSVKYYDGNDWIELPAEDIDSFIDMLQTAQEERENLKRVTLMVNEIAFSPPGLLKSATVQTVKPAQGVGKTPTRGRGRGQGRGVLFFFSSFF